MAIIQAADLYYLTIAGLVEAARACPSRRARMMLAHAIGWTAFRASRAKRTAIESSLHDAFDGALTATERQLIVQSVFRECWVELLQWRPSSNEQRVFANTPIEGRAHLSRALDAGRGAILWESRGFGGRLAAKQILKAHGLAVHQVHGPNNLGGLLTSDASATWVRRAIVRPFFDRLEGRFVASVFNLPADGSLGFTRRLLGLLRQNEIICITGDGQAGLRLREVHFLGGPEQVSTGMVTLAELSGAAILPIFCAREHGAPRLTIEAPIRIDDTLDHEQRVTAGAQQYMSRLEHWIRRYPGQFRNWHLISKRPDAERPRPDPRDRQR